jgi:hypothetical protein
MEVYLLEIYENKEANIPDFGLVFKSMELLLKYTEQRITKLQPNFRDDAEELEETGLALSLNDEETVRVTILPVIEDADDDKYNKYVSHKGEKEQEKEEEKEEEGKGKKEKEEEKEEEEEGKGKKEKEEEKEEEEEGEEKKEKEEEEKEKEEEEKEKEEEEEEKEEKEEEEEKEEKEEKEENGKKKEEKEEKKDEDEEGDGGKMVDGVYVTDGGETEIPSKSENTISTERIKDGDTLIDFHDNKDNKEITHT